MKCTTSLHCYSDYDARQQATQQFSEYLREYRWLHGKKCDDDVVGFFSAKERQVGNPLLFNLTIFTFLSEQFWNTHTCVCMCVCVYGGLFGVSIIRNITICYKESVSLDRFSSITKRGWCVCHKEVYQLFQDVTGEQHIKHQLPFREYQQHSRRHTHYFGCHALM